MSFKLQITSLRFPQCNWEGAVSKNPARSLWNAQLLWKTRRKLSQCLTYLLEVSAFGDRYLAPLPLISGCSSANGNEETHTSLVLTIKSSHHIWLRVQIYQHLAPPGAWSLALTFSSQKEIRKITIYLKSLLRTVLYHDTRLYALSTSRNKPRNAASGLRKCNNGWVGNTGRQLPELPKFSHGNANCGTRNFSCWLKCKKSLRSL